MSEISYNTQLFIHEYYIEGNWFVALPVQTAAILSYIIQHMDYHYSMIRETIGSETMFKSYEVKDSLHQEKLRMLKINSYIIPQSFDEHVELLQQLNLIIIYEDSIVFPKKINKVSDCFKILDIKAMEIIKNFEFLKKYLSLIDNIICNNIISYNEIKKHSIPPVKLLEFLTKYFRCKMYNGMIILESEGKDAHYLVASINQMKKLSMNRGGRLF